MAGVRLQKELMESIENYIPKWEIGTETFRRLDGSPLVIWYVKDFDKNRMSAGGFETEKQAITYLVNVTS